MFCWRFIRLFHHCLEKIASYVIFVTVWMWNVSHRSTCLILYPQLLGCSEVSWHFTICSLLGENRPLEDEFLGISPLSVARSSYNDIFNIFTVFNNLIICNKILVLLNYKVIGTDFEKFIILLQRNSCTGVRQCIVKWSVFNIPWPVLLTK